MNQQISRKSSLIKWTDTDKEIKFFFDNHVHGCRKVSNRLIVYPRIQAEIRTQ